MRTIAILTALGAMFAPGAVVHAAIAFFEYTQEDATTGAGTLTADINTTRFGGPGLLTFTGVMPPATVSSIYTAPPAVPSFAVGAIDPLNDGFNEISGVHIGWSGSTTISAVDPNNILDTWAIEVPLIQVDNGFYHWKIDFEEDPDAGFDFQTFGGAADEGNDRARFAVWVGDYLSGHRETQDRVGFDPFDFGDPLAEPETYTAEESVSPGSNSFGDDLGINAAIRSGVITAESGPLLVDQFFYEGPLTTDDTTLTLNGVPKSKLPVLPTDPFNLILDIGPMDQRTQSGHTGLPDPLDASTPGDGDEGSPAGIVLDTGTGALFTVSIDNVSQEEETEGDIDWRDRGDSTSGAQDLVQLGEDFIFNDSGITRLTFEDLPPGEYDAVSYHIDPDNDDVGAEPADGVRAFVNNGDGAGFVEKGSILGLTADPNLEDVNLLTTTAVEDTSVSFSFTADGLNPVVIIFDSTPIDTITFPSGCGDDPDEAFCETPLNGLSLSYEPGFPGDVNGDELVDELDLDIIFMNFFETEVDGNLVELSDGDLNRDKIVDFLDYRLWKFYVPVPLAASSESVPEPASLAILLLGGAALLGIRRRF